MSFEIIVLIISIAMLVWAVYSMARSAFGDIRELWSLRLRDSDGRDVVLDPSDEQSISRFLAALQR